MKVLNLVGPQVRKFRYNRCWSQSKLAIQLQLKGLDVSREVIAQIEGQCHCVKDKDLPYFARVFQVGLTDLFPNLDPDKPIHDTVSKLKLKDLLHSEPAPCEKGISCRRKPRKDWG